MRARSIKPSLFKNELLGAADPLFTVVFEGLWCLADREGRLEDRPLRIHVEVNPYRDSASTVLSLDWLVLHRFVARYEVGGEKYLAIVNFRKHQQPHIKEAPSRIPPEPIQGVVSAPVEHGASTEVAALTPSSLTADCGLLTPDSLNPPLRVPAPRGTVIRKPEVVAKIRSVYPGEHTEAAWLRAERHIEFLIGGGTASADLVGAAGAYAMREAAKGNTSAFFAPDNFFGKGEWRGPFVVPKKPETAVERIRRKNPLPSDFEREAIEHVG